MIYSDKSILKVDKISARLGIRIYALPFLLGVIGLISSIYFRDISLTCLSSFFIFISSLLMLSKIPIINNRGYSINSQGVTIPNYSIVEYLRNHSVFIAYNNIDDVKYNKNSLHEVFISIHTRDKGKKYLIFKENTGETFFKYLLLTFKKHGLL